MLIPSFPEKGDKVGIVAPAMKVDKASILQGIKIIESWGLQVLTGKALFSSFRCFAGTDEQRLSDLQDAIDNPDLKAVFFARGGYGTTRILDNADFSPLLNSPKWFCGFSDATALLLHLFSLGIASMHGPMLSTFNSLNRQATGRLKCMLKGKPSPLFVCPHSLNRLGKTKGKLIGGNLSLVCNTLATTSTVFPQENLILFIEDINEPLYCVDRMMVQLKRAGILKQLKGLVAGDFSGIQDDDDFGASAEEIILSHVHDYDFPVAFHFPIGHIRDNRAVFVGLEHRLQVESNRALLDAVFT